LKVVHYLNQFFAGLGGEQAASSEPVRLDGAVGPGKGLGIEVAHTLACGDDFFGEHEDEALVRLIGWLEDDSPDVLICGPAFDSGRYGYACGVLAREAARRGFAVVAGMHPENPGVIAAEGGAYIVPTGASVTSMKDALPKLAALVKKLGAGEPVGPPQEEGYLPRGLRVNQLQAQTGAARAIDMLLSKLDGIIRTEVEPPADTVAPPDPVADMGRATLALVTEAGCVPQGNPDGLPSRRSHMWLRYGIEGERSLGASGYQTVHGGFDTTAANQDPNRLVPLDAVRELEEEGKIGRLHDSFYTTAGVDTPVASAARFGQEIAKELKDAGVQAVLLTGT
jgi:betaine reductase